MRAFNWSISANEINQPAIEQRGEFAVPAALRIQVEAPAGETRALALQLDHVSKIKLFVLNASILDGTLSIKSGAPIAPTISLHGPLILFGPAVAVLGSSLQTLTVTNANPDQPATLDLLVGYEL
jgi:hypothetical protein